MVVDTVREYLAVLLPTMSLELFDVQFRREGRGWVLRVFIDTPAGVSLDDCAEVSRALSQYLDVEDCIDHAYHLEVSSPGIERPLRSVGEFERYLGKKAKVKLHDPLDGVKIFEGVIKEVDGDKIVLDLDADRSVVFQYDWINKARLAL